MVDFRTGQDIVWIISMATAVGIAVASDPPNISQAAMVMTGRTRLPPANNLCVNQPVRRVHRRRVDGVEVERAVKF